MLFESRFITGRHGNGEPDEQTSREVVHYENEARATRRSTLGQAELTVELAKRYGHLPPKTSVAPIDNLDGNRVELTVSIPSGWLIHAAAVPLPADEKARPGELSVEGYILEYIPHETGLPDAAVRVFLARAAVCEGGLARAEKVEFVGASLGPEPRPDDYLVSWPMQPGGVTPLDVTVSRYNAELALLGELYHLQPGIARPTAT